jgi:predicted ATPase
MLDECEALSSDELEAHVQEFRFNQVAFVMPPRQAIYRCDTERDQSFVQSVSVFDDLRNWYARWGYQLVEVPRVAVDERVDFLIETAAAVLTSRPGRLTG